MYFKRAFSFFSSSSSCNSLNRSHVRTRFQGNSFPCDPCGKAFTCFGATFDESDQIVTNVDIMLQSMHRLHLSTCETLPLTHDVIPSKVHAFSFLFVFAISRGAHDPTNPLAHT
jgi:hypothetical protein